MQPVTSTELYFLPPTFTSFHPSVGKYMIYLTEKKHTFFCSKYELCLNSCRSGYILVMHQESST